MKKVLILIMALFMLTGCSSNNIKNISYKDLNKKFENKETFILYFDGTDDEILKDTLNKVLDKNNLTAYRLDTNKLKEEQITELRYKADYEEPSIIFIKEGIDPSVITHVTDIYTTEETLTTKLTELGFIEINTNTDLNEE